MKKIGLFTVATAFVALLIGTGSNAANAAAYTVAHTDTAAAGSLTVTGSTFTFTDPADVISGLGAGDLTITGDYSGTVATDITATLVESPSTTLDLISDGSGSFFYIPAFDFAAANSITGSNGATLSYSTTSLVAGSFTSAGGSYTTPAPEASSVIALGAMLAAGGLLLFAAKRRSTATIA